MDQHPSVKEVLLALQQIQETVLPIYGVVGKQQQVSRLLHLEITQ
jgi:hypothetical protein